MNTPVNAETASQAKKRWPRVLFAVVVLSMVCCIAMVIAINFAPWTDIFKLIGMPTGSSEAKIQYGVYQDFRYTPNRGSFSCDFSHIMDSSFNAVMYDSTQTASDGSFSGDVWANDDFGTEYGLSYFQLPANFQATEDHLRQMGNVLMAGFQQKNPGTQVLDQKLVDNDRFLMVFHLPHASNLTMTTTKGGQNDTTIADLRQVYYIFVEGQWEYFVSYGVTPIALDDIVTPTPWSPADTEAMQSRLDEFYKGCEFKK